MYCFFFNLFIITTYSSSGSSPLRATFQISNTASSYFSNTTQFNIVSEVDLRVKEAINYTGSTIVETEILSYLASVFIVNRCSLTISNIDMYRDVVADKLFDIPLIIAVNQQTHLITMKNMDFHISGRILRGIQPMNLFVENVFMDFYGMMGGIYINADWNYPGASITGDIYMNNVTAINSQTRIVQLMNGLLFYSGPANVTIQNSNILLYGSLASDRSLIEIQLDNECLPNDENIQTITMNNNLITLPSNPYSDKFIKFYVNVIDSYPRKIVGNFLNNDISNVESNLSPIFSFVFTTISEIIIANNKIANVSSQQGIITIDTMKSVKLLNSGFYNSSDFGHNLYYFSNVQDVFIQNITVQNVNATGKLSDFFFLFDIINKGTVTVDMVYMDHVNFGLQAGFYINGLMRKVSYTNMYFSNIRIGNQNRLISTGEFNSITMNNITFINSFDQ